MPPCGGWEEEELSVEQAGEYEVKIFRSSCLDEGCSPDDRGWIDPSCFKKDARILDSEGDVVASFEGDEAEVVDLAHPAVGLVLLVRNFGASSHSLRYVLYSTEPELKKLGEINSPINKWQANKRQDTEREPDGFYLDRQGDLLIDRLVERGMASSNALAEYDVETLKVGRDGLTSLGRRDLDVDAYHRHGQASEGPPGRRQQ